MAEFLCFLAERQSFVKDLRARKAEADEARDEERGAAVTIQRHWRGSQTRDDITQMLFAALMVQRVFRGCMGRKRVAAAKQAAEEERARALRAFFATQITRIVRGFLSRRLLLNFYERRRTVEKRREVGHTLREQLQSHLQEQLETKANEEEEKARRQFSRATEGLHHLVSTRAQPGIYNPPYALGDEDVPSAFNVPLEEHLRDGSKRFVRTHGLSSQRWPRALSREERRALRALKEVGGDAAVRSLRRQVDDAERSGLLQPLTETGRLSGEAGLMAPPPPRSAPRAGDGVDVARQGPEAMAVTSATAAAAVRLGRGGEDRTHMAVGAGAMAAEEEAELAELQAGVNMHGYEAMLARALRKRSAVRPSQTGGSEKDAPPDYIDRPSSLQASVPYGVEREGEREAARQARVRRLRAGEMRAGGRVQPGRHEVGVHASAPYEEAWKASRSTRELEHTAEAKSKRTSHLPFVSTGGRVPSFEASARQKTQMRASGGRRSGVMALAGRGVLGSTGQRGGSAQGRMKQ